MIITDAAALRLALVAQMRGIPELVALLNNDAANIQEYEEKDNGDLYSVIRKLRAPKMLVYFAGISANRFPARFDINIGIAVRVDNPTSIYAAFLGGTSTSSGTDGQPMVNSTVHPSYDPMAIPRLERRQIPLNDTTFFDYWELATAFSDKKS